MAKPYPQPYCSGQCNACSRGRSMNLNFFLRMAKWAHNPPSAKRVILVLAVIGICLALYAIERWIGWPEWLTPATGPRGRILR